MTYSTLMVQLESGVSNHGVLGIARDLADRHRARVIGISAVQPLELVCNETYIPGEVFELEREETRKAFDEAEAEFRAAFSGGPESIEWRSMVTLDPISAYVARESRSADLIIVGRPSGARVNNRRTLNTGDLVMRAGRPVLMVPDQIAKPKLDRVLIAWKDTREARRAVVDALPLLRAASHVVVVEIASEEQLPDARARIDDVAAWLGRHGVRAQRIASRHAGANAERLKEIIGDQRSDLLVAGAYGHNRLAEWAFGGVTRDLLLNADACSLLSH